MRKDNKIKLEVGMKVRIISGKNLGKQGKVLEIGQKPEKMESGLEAIMVEVEGVGRVPGENIEIIK